jgi:hypothetical protein
MKLKRILKLGTVALAILAIFLAGCGAPSKITKENFDKIKVGMTYAEVNAILGEPTESSSLDIAGFSGTNSTWKFGDAVITIQFINGQVVSRQYSKPAK